MHIIIHITIISIIFFFSIRPVRFLRFLRFLRFVSFSSLNPPSWLKYIFSSIRFILLERIFLFSQALWKFYYIKRKLYFRRVTLQKVKK